MSRSVAPLGPGGLRSIRRMAKRETDPLAQRRSGWVKRAATILKSIDWRKPTPLERAFAAQIAGSGVQARDSLLVKDGSSHGSAQG